MIRRAIEKDISQISNLLSQVCLVHHNGRPDIFKVGRKYSDDELKALLTDGQRPILVCVNENDDVMGYCFCIYQQHIDNSVLTDIKTLYIDDLCVDEVCRGQYVGRAIYEFVLAESKRNGCAAVTLNVWCLNTGAMKFYERCGMTPLKIVMEQRLDGE